MKNDRANMEVLLCHQEIYPEDLWEQYINDMVKMISNAGGND